MEQGFRRGLTLVAGLTLSATLLTSSAGCGRTNEVTLHQPFAPPSQQNLALTAVGAYRRVDDGEQACVLTFPLPGAKDGPRAFVVYVSGPDALGQLPVNAQDPDAARGFLIQEVGDLAGRTDFVAGTVRFAGVWLAPNRRRLDLDVRCEDGTEIRGRAVLERCAPEVRALQHQYAADVEQLSTPSQPTQAGRRNTTRAQPGEGVGSR